MYALGHGFTHAYNSHGFIGNNKVQAHRCLRPVQVISGVPGGLFSGEVQQSSIPISVDSWSLFIRRRRADQPCSHLL